jgi:hypothetical protein
MSKNYANTLGMDVAGEKSGIKHAYNLIMNICKIFKH